MMKMRHIAVLAGCMTLASACSDYLDVNTNPNGPQTVTANLYLPPMLHWLVTSPQFDGRHVGHYTQEWVSTSTLVSPAQTWGKMGYDPGSDNGAQQWRDVYWSLGQNLVDMAPLLWMFLFLLVAGSFACVQVVTDAIKEKKVGTIVQMLVVESAVMFFEVIFLYRELIDAITPWIAQQSGDSVHLGIGATLALASFGWLGVRGMSWFLFGRFGTPALLAVLSRKSIEHEGSARPAAAAASPELWRGPIKALKEETEWFHQEAKRMLELLTLPVLQLLAAAINFAVIVVQSRPRFVLPFKSLEDVLEATPAPFHSHRERDKGKMRTPMDPMPRIAS